MMFDIYIFFLWFRSIIKIFSHKSNPIMTYSFSFNWFLFPWSNCTSVRPRITFAKSSFFGSRIMMKRKKSRWVVCFNSTLCLINATLNDILIYWYGVCKREDRSIFRTMYSNRTVFDDSQYFDGVIIIITQYSIAFVINKTLRKFIQKHQITWILRN